MTTLYRPVTIASAEQAATFPPGTLVNLGDRLMLWDTGMKDNPSRVIGGTALVPIEAEEETRVTPEAFSEACRQTLARLDYARTFYAPPPGPPVTVLTESRLVTRWEPS